MHGLRFLQEFKTRKGRKVILRPLRKRDLGALTRFANNIAKERKSNRELGIVSLEKRVTRAEEKEFLEKGLKGMKLRRYVCVAAFDGAKMVGNCDISGRRPGDVKHTGVLGIVILDGYRGEGLGERMIRTALEEAGKLGIWLVELEVFATNLRARRLYGKIGFREVGTIPEKIQRDGRPIDEVSMYVILPH